MKLRVAVARADRALQVGATRYAAELCQHILHSFPTDLQLRSILGHAAMEQGLLDLALQQFDGILELDPENVDAWSASGVVHGAAGRLNAALGAFERAYELNPCQPAVAESLVQLYTQRDGRPGVLSAAPAVAVIRWQLRHANLDSALDAAHRFLIDQPGHLPILLACAEALWRDGRWDAAERACRQLLTRSPRLLKPRLILGQILSADRAREIEGIEILRAALTEDPSGTVARRLFDRTSFAPPYLADELSVSLPDALLAAPPEVEVALQVLPSKASDTVEDEWRPPEITVVADSSASQERPGSIWRTLESMPGTNSNSGAPLPGAPTETLLVISCRGPLVARYGAAGVQRLERRLQVMARELASLGSRVIYAFVDDPGSMAQFQLPAVSATDPFEIKRAIDDLDRVIAANSPGVDGLLILGGEEIVPFFCLPNPADDDDEVIPTDNPYGVTSGGSSYLPDLPVGRLPDGDGSNLSLLLRQLDTLIEQPRRPRIIENKPRILQAGRAALGALGIGHSSGLTFGCSAASWGAVAEHALSSLAPGVSIQLSPPTSAESFEVHRLAGRRFLFFNLHGLADSSSWYGQPAEVEEDGHWTIPPAISADAVSLVDLDAPIVFSTASFAGRVSGRSTGTSLALRFLGEGATAVVGATVMTYGATEPPLHTSDLLGQLFWTNLRRGDRIGVALQRARRDYVRQVMASQGYLDGDDQKTLLEFVLLGHPLAPVFLEDGATSEPPLASDDLVFLCDQSTTGSAGRAISSGVLRSAIEELLDRCPEAEGGSVRVYRRGPCRGSCRHSGHQVASGSSPVAATITVRRELRTTDGGCLVKVARATVSDRGDLIRCVVSR